MSSESKDPGITNLAQSILENTKEVARYLQTSGIALPTFSPTAEALPTTPDFQKLQARLRTQLEDLQLLVEGPPRFYRYFLTRGYDLGVFQTALDFGFFTLVPPEGDIALKELASQAGLDPDRTGRMMRLLITQRFFQENRPGFFAHNSFSIALQRDEDMRSMVHMSFDEMLKACAEAGAAIKANPFKTDGVHCPFYARFGVPVYDYFEKYPENSGRFAKAMAGWRKSEYSESTWWQSYLWISIFRGEIGLTGFNKVANATAELTDNYPWANIEGTVVDIGGGSGHVSMEMAQLFPHLKFAVQDCDESVLAEGQQLLSDDIRDRISFTKTNFFEPQRFLGASVYLLRQCTCNWVDHDIVTIFKSVVPGLESSDPNTPLLINDMIIPEPGSEVERLWERERRQVDITMLMLFGAKQRTVAEFKTLLKEADTRYVIRKVHEQGALGLLEVYLDRGDGVNNIAS